MGSRGRRKQRWCSAPPLTPLLEGPDLDVQHQGTKKEISSWEVIREWFRAQRSLHGGGSFSTYGSSHHHISPPKRQDLKLLLGVLGCPLAPIPLPAENNIPIHHLDNNIRDINIPIENSAARYIIQQYLAASGCLKQQTTSSSSSTKKKNMYAVGMVKMVCCPTEISSGKGVKTLGTKTWENGCFVLWQMSPGMWSLELVVGGGNYKVLAGSDSKIVWRHTPWLGTHAAKGPQRPLRRIIQGLDPKSTASLFAKAQCLGEKRIGEDDCFVLKVAADRADVMERNEGPAEVIRHVLYGYFSQKSGLLIYLEDSHLTRVAVQAAGGGCDHHENNNSDDDDAVVYWETTIGSSIGDYRDVDGVLIAHQGRTIATVFRFGETSMEHCRTRMEEVWQIHDVVYNVPGLSIDSFIPPAVIFQQPIHSP